MCNRIKKKKVKFNVKKLEEEMINAAKSNLESFEFKGNTYLLSCRGNFVQTIINNRVLLRIPLNKKPKTENINSYICNLVS